jgi:Leucine-rich repeat (LRR) protein
MLSSFTNLEEGYLIGSKLPFIPDDAFAISYPIGEQIKLKKLDFSSNLIKSVGNFAFMGLPNLSTLSLYQNRIDFIGEDSFRFATSSTVRLTLTLSYNALNGSSFEVGAFSYFDRPVDLYMEYNYITYLDEAVFRPFLNQTVLNRLWLHGNPFVADCRMQWLVNDKELFEVKVLGVTCQYGRNIFRYSPEEFAHCSCR